MAEKQITTNQLAKMIKKGFDGVDEKIEKLATKEQHETLDKRLGVVEKDVKYIKENLGEADKISERVDYIENILNVQVVKK